MTPSILTTASSSIPWNEALSGVSGSISLAAWIFLLFPQLIENYRNGSAGGVSLLFLAVWFVGDITNLAGALWAGLVPTVIALAIYFCFADIVLISQCLYYNFLNARAERKESVISTNAVEQDEEAPLLSRQHSDNMVFPPPNGHRRRRSSAASSRRGHPRRTSVARSDELLAGIQEEGHSVWKTVLKNTLSILGICVVGVVGWAIAWKAGLWAPPVPGKTGPIGAQVLGYISAVCYLGARIPQIIKNQRDRSCEGLSLLFFILSVLGNATYGAGILFHSIERDYVLTNLPWLIGSLGTMAEDGIIFVQFHTFGDQTVAPE